VVPPGGFARRLQENLRTTLDYIEIIRQEAIEIDSILAMIYRGEVAAFDQAAHTVVVGGKEGEKTFDVSQATMKGEVEPQPQ
jgi:hypothetical protein